MQGPNVVVVHKPHRPGSLENREVEADESFFKNTSYKPFLCVDKNGGHKQSFCVGIKLDYINPQK